MVENFIRFIIKHEVKGKNIVNDERYFRGKGRNTNIKRKENKKTYTYAWNRKKLVQRKKKYTYAGNRKKLV